MGSNWSIVRVGDLTDSISETHKFEKDYLIFLNTSDVLLGKLLHNLYSEVKNWPGQAKKSIKKDDILFSEIRPANGRWAYIDFEADDYVVSTKLMVIRTRTSRVLPKFFYYFLTSSGITWELQHLAESRSGTFPQITFDQVSELKLSLPPVPVQRIIVSFLDTLDDKIELNRRMNETLEAMARSIFNSWFVDFDPVCAKSEGRNSALPKHIADLFPASFEDTELGEIPKGWKVRPFSTAVEIIGGGTPKTNVDEYWNGDIPWFSVADAPNENDVFVIDTKKKINQTGIDHSATRILPIGTTIISARGTVGKVALVGVPMTMNQSCYGLQGTGAGPYFTYFATRQLVVALKQRSHGSVFDTITRDTMAGVAVVVPSRAELNIFEALVAPQMERIRHNLIESRTLAALRDALLPKLISGELRINVHLKAESG